MIHSLFWFLYYSGVQNISKKDSFTRPLVCPRTSLARYAKGNTPAYHTSPNAAYSPDNWQFTLLKKQERSMRIC